ncbi:alpha/beta hydrolase [Umezawaea sp. Da 62-37]|uniref:alpha/beta fold hydrolase n=1 Tax=Umezawaea sp. Da 62-37 TaxID=3075927 RepID=UPI0028F73FC8|nr:alpha/beta hydrolase [Umezawaea sp. Da 62-37]WNV88531.1 alpha/beta hydrolase [Umezawaea sp. Da 62-37]
MIVLLHGLGCTKKSFEQIASIPELSDFTTCAFDLPGHGSSPVAPTDEHSLQTYADITNLVVKQLSPTRVHLVGHSMGGAVGLIATQEMNRLESFISIEGNLVADDCGLVSRKTANLSREEFICRGYASFLRDLESSKEPDMQHWAEWYASCAPSAIHDGSRSLVEWSDSGKLLELYRSLRSRAFVYGERGDRFGHLLPLLPAQDTFNVPNSDHFPMVDNPTALYATLSSIILGC